MAWPIVVIDTTNMDAASDNPGNARAAIKQMADNVNAIKDSKGAVNGIAELDAGGTVPASQLPVQPANKGGTGHFSFSIGDIFYANSTSTLAKLAAGSAGNVLTSNGAGSPPSYQVAGGVPSGTRMVFNQTTAPIGWTKDTSTVLNDSIMRIVTGAVGSGGSTAFSTFNGQTSVGATTLTESQIPNHVHQETYVNPSTGLATGAVRNSAGVSSTQTSIYASTSGSTPYNNTPVALNTVATGGGGSHTHTMTASIKYNDFIICQKD